VTLRRGLLPDVPIYALVSVVPESLGGLTTAALQRSSGFADVDRRRIEVLTKSDAMIDPAVRTRQLQTAGQLSSGVRLRNVWFELMDLADEDLHAVPTPQEPVVPSDDVAVASEGDAVATRTAPDGSVLQTDHLRSDGTRAISDRRDVRERGTRGGRLITLFARDGRPAAQWTSLREMYVSWVDMVIGGRESILIIDSAPTGGLFFDYQRDHVTTVQCIHTHHLRQMRQDARVKNTVDVMRMLTHLDWFDGVAVLTGGQLRGLEAAGVVGDNGTVLPNMLVDPPVGGPRGHDPSRGVIVGRQASVKRLDHAVRAIARAVEAGADVHVDMYGHGQQSDKLTALGEQLGLGAHVTQHGYDPHAKANFAQASFTLMCSKYEGFGLVLIEAMSVGCIPIAYDVEYGPGDLITHGVDGFLVPDGDIEALGDAIAALRTMDDAELMRMRRAAIRRAREFSPRNVTKQWGRALRDAQARHRTLREARATATLVESVWTDSGLRLVADIAGDGTSEVQTVKLTWIGRGREAYGRVETAAAPIGSGIRIDAVIDPRRLDDVEPGAVLDISVDVLAPDTWARTRIASTPEQMPERAEGLEPYATAGGNLSIRRV
jgi:poly(glycerol-phosphate) alpha-glucosyltransferase